MIRFAEPLLLLLLFLIPIILYFKNRRIISIQYSRVELLSNLPKSWKLRIQPILPILYTLGLFAIIIAIARPQKGIDESIIRTEAVDIILLLDLSESMDTRDFNRANQPISRLDASKEVIENAIEFYEPRAKVLELIVNASPDKNVVTVSLQFQVVNTEEVVILETSISRLR